MLAGLKLVLAAGVDFPNPASQFPRMRLFASRTAEHLHWRRSRRRVSAFGLRKLSV